MCTSGANSLKSSFFQKSGLTVLILAIRKAPYFSPAYSAKITGFPDRLVDSRFLHAIITFVVLMKPPDSSKGLGGFVF